MAQPAELISAAEIAKRVAELGRQIHDRIPDGPLTVVGVLRGAFVFMADLVRVIPRPMTCDFLGVRSSGDAKLPATSARPSPTDTSCWSRTSSIPV
jgi:hypoxanthine phosphoribosyltransferase